MSAPEDGPEREARRHRPALIGMAICLAVVGLLLLGYVVWAFENGTPPEGADQHKQVLPEADMAE